MILDKILLENIGIVGRKLLNEANLATAPSNIEEMHRFLESLKVGIEKNEFSALLLGKILFSFVSSVEVRNRKTTARTFEDIFSGLFEQVSTDTAQRKNPISPDIIRKYDIYSEGKNWNISSDVSANKREKSDLNLGDYKISLKTLKGPVYDENNVCINNELNPEMNIGSFSYRALFTGILSDDVVNNLSDRKGGLGSAKQLRINVFDVIKKNNKQEEFLQRFNDLFKYVYEEDIYIVLKSHYQIKFILIPKETFVNTVIQKYQYEEETFHDIIQRWENNNLRFKWKNLLKSINNYSFPYKEININLSNAVNNKELLNFENKLSKDIKKYIEKNLQ